jgi:hypothetical protein
MDIRVYTAEEVLAIGHRQETEPWTAAEALAAMESDYRRGYRDGWYQAIDAAWDLLQARVSRAEAYQRCFNHWRGPLDEWSRKVIDVQVHGEDLVTSGMKHDGPYETGGDWPPRISTRKAE